MSTRATIKFSEGDYQYFVYRGHDGFPENILCDIKDTIDKSKHRWSEPELECLVTLFLARGYDFENKRLPTYEISSCFHGDESYIYFVSWDFTAKEWTYGVSE
jgi:hypothetical protein